MSACVVPLRDRASAPTPKVRDPGTANKQPPPLPSMRVPKGTTASNDQSLDDDWDWKIAAARARVAADEHEWQAALNKAKTTSIASDEVEWSGLRAQAAARQRAAEEREWAERVARARTAVHTFSMPWSTGASAHMFSTPSAARVVAWP